MKHNRWVLGLLIMVAGVVLVLAYRWRPQSTTTALAPLSKPVGTAVESSNVLELSDQDPILIVNAESTPAAAADVRAPIPISVPSVKVLVKVVDTSGSLIRDTEVTWEGTRGGQYGNGATVVAVDGSATLSVPIECRQVRVSASAGGRIPAFKIVSGLARASRTTIPGYEDTNILIELTLTAVGLSGACAAWGIIFVDDKKSAPDGLKLTIAPRTDGESTPIPLDKCAVIVDARQCAYFIVGSPPDRYALQAASALTIPTLGDVVSASPRGQRRDLKLRSGNTLRVTVIDFDSKQPLSGCEVSGEYQAAMMGNIPDLPGARLFRLEERRSITDGRGVAYLRGLQAGASMTVRCSWPMAKEPYASRSLILDEAGKETEVEITLGLVPASLSKLSGLVNYCCKDAGSSCEVVASAGDPPHEIVSGPVIDGTWNLETDFIGDVQLWVRCGGQRISGCTSFVLTSNKVTQRIRIPPLNATAILLKWLNAPVGWRLKVTQPGRVDQESAIESAEGVFSVIADADRPLLCCVEDLNGAFEWLSVLPNKATLTLKFSAAPPRQLLVDIPHRPDGSAYTASISGYVLFEDLDVKSPVLFRRIRSPIKDGAGILAFDVERSPMYYYVESTCKPGLIAGLLDLKQISGKVSVGSDCAWVSAGAAGDWSSVYVEAIAGRNIGTQVPPEMRLCHARSLSCLAVTYPNAPAQDVLVPGQAANIRFVRGPE